VLVLTLVAPLLTTNCYVLAAAKGSECLVVDAGAGAAQEVERVVAEHGLRPVAVAATHGHVDHLWDAGRVCARYGVPFLVHERDAHRLADPLGTLGPMAAALDLDPAEHLPPERVEVVRTPHRGAARLEVAGLPLTWLHAPGHTQGASLLSVPRAPGPGSRLDLAEWVPAGAHPARTVLSGDVLFAGTVGRTDLPGGDAAEMSATIDEQLSRLPNDTLVLPGHGPATWLEVEYRRNPFLAVH